MTTITENSAWVVVVHCSAGEGCGSSGSCGNWGGSWKFVGVRCSSEGLVVAQGALCLFGKLRQSTDPELSTNS